MRISEPLRFAPPARSKQMKGILPCPPAMLQSVQRRVSACIAGDMHGAACALPERASMPSMPVAATTAGPVMRPRGHEVPTRDRARVIGVQDRLVEAVSAGKLLADEHDS